MKQQRSIILLHKDIFHMWQMKTKTKQQKLSITYGNPKYYIMTSFYIHNFL